MRGAAALAVAAGFASASAAFAQAAPAAAPILRTEPAAAAPAAAPAPGPPIVTYVALGLSGLAAVLGGSALGLVLTGRRRVEDLADGLRQRSASDDARATTDRIARIEATLRDLAEASARRPGPAPAASNTPTARDLFPRSPVPAAPAREAAPPPPAAASADRLPEWVEQVRARFTRLALDPSSATAAFIAEFSPRGALAGPRGVALLDGFEGAKLWAVRAPGDAEVWALTPGEAAVVNWSAHFAPHRTRVAAEVFGEAFDLVEGGGELRLEEPALVRRDLSDRLTVRRRGRLSGFRG